MPATATLDTIEGTQLDITGQVYRYARGGYVEGLSSSSSTADILFQCVSAVNMPAFGSALSSAFGGVLLARMQVQPLSDDTAAVKLYYETLAGMFASAYVLTDDSFLGSCETNLVTGTRTPIRINDTPIMDDNGKVVGAAGGDSLTMTFMRPMRQLSLYQLCAGSPRTDSASATGCVNNATWQGLGVGCWLLSQYKTEISKYQGFYTRTAAAITRSVGPAPEDWSDTGILKNSVTGRYIDVDAGLITANLALPYQHGLIGTPGVDMDSKNKFTKGYARVGQYWTTDFSAIFGFN